MQQSLYRQLATAKSESVLFAKDLADWLLRRREALIPPRRLMYDGPQDVTLFKANGAEFLRYYTELCSLKPHESVLDVGSGMGRKTIPLTQYLSPVGQYEGLDVNQSGVDWCRRQISSRFPNFRFQLIDVYSSRYNPNGRQQAEAYTYPFATNHFDFAVLASVFTHMLPKGVERYLAETARVLKARGGRCLISYFLLNSAQKPVSDTGMQTRLFPINQGLYCIKSEAQPEDAVAFDETYIRQLYQTCGLEIVEIYYGAWRGQPPFLSYQDLILARKA